MKQAIFIEYERLKNYIMENLTMSSLHLVLLRWSNDDEVGGACIVHAEIDKWLEILVGKSRGNWQSWGLDVNERIKWNDSVWTG